MVMFGKLWIGKIQSCKEIIIVKRDNIKILHGKRWDSIYFFAHRIHFIKRMIDRIFVSKVVNKDKFEWEKTQDIDHEKIIYIRDIWLSWYVVGKCKI